MTKSFLVFPTGSAGIALCLIRFAVALALVAMAPWVASDMERVALFVLAGTILIGLYLRIGAGVAAIVGLIVWVRLGGNLGTSAAIHGLCAAALSLLGGGGYSVDARLFGRRVIEIDR
jgi:hypothetical protein